MKKIYSYLAAAVAALALNACSEDSFTQDDLVKAAEEQAGDAISFGTYLGTAGTTRAGTENAISSVSDLATKGGFGVFAWLSDGGADGLTLFDNSSITSLPNFMYN